MEALPAPTPEAERLALVRPFNCEHVKPKPKPRHARANDLVTEDSAAQEFAERYDGRLRFCHGTGAWFEWTGTHWKQNLTGLAFQWARELARDLSENQADRIRYATRAEGGRACRSHEDIPRGPSATRLQGSPKKDGTGL